ncbi:MAG: efflux RND transporter permease subunit [Ewingella americana]|jgi:multidrug efflux pump|uniref:efflux RND transporter permease subunit n=1 Tax=Ewingella americana TaxID=41202 RepID=UPI002431ACF0|nr:efflux RND transporter permease subunit [Ewingella americana]MCI1679350.1 efflux RND transporter permease subunit [Ewingella americana]MCI1854677.1 efflux RND transporter permease subunit [Ewingella americana]MCI1862040.1 efflux RND transporter permease subunit [Ewingella americana]MCI2142579.1 efflux RND transporter permease subunit [Ewingella americana]MCI2162247.1 efflux RND transporter permease subunit [Ewingella americana]
MNISRFFIFRPVTTLLLTSAVLLLGLLGYRLLPVAPLPQLDLPVILVSASLPGASPETMAATVATPLERALGQIAGVTEMTSSSSQGTTSVVLQFDLDREINGAARDVQAAINASRALLPSSMPSLPTYRKANPSDAPIIMLSLTSATRSKGELYDIASSQLQQKIAQVNGVGQVSIVGSALPGVRIDLRPEAISHYGISLDTIRAAIANSTTNLPKGVLQGSNQSWMIEGNGQQSTAAQYKTLIVTYIQGAAIRLSDVANVYDSVEDKYNVGYYNSTPSVMLGVTRQAGANMLETIQAIKNALPQMEENLPGDVELHIALDRSGTISGSLRATEVTLLEATVLVIAVVFVFLRNLQAVIIPALALPVSLIGTCSVMYLLGYSLDNLSLMALIIATGFVVDDAIVVLENITRHIEEGLGPVRAAIKGAQEVSFTVLSMTLSLVAVFIPLLLMGGILGRLFREFAVTLTVSLVISMLVSLSLTPMLCARFLRRKPAVEKRQPRIYRLIERWLNRLLAGYAAALGWVMRHQLITMFGLLLTIMLNFYLYTVVEKGFFPEQDTGMLMGMMRADQNTSFQTIQPKLLEYSKIIQDDPAVDAVMSSAGSGGFGSRNTALFFVRLKDIKDRTATASQVANRLMAKTSKLAGAQLFMQAAQDLRVGARSANAQYQYSLQADDLSLLREWGPKVKAALEKLPQLTGVDSDSQTGGQEVYLNIDRDKATRLGVNVKMIDTLLNNAFSQRQIATIYKTLNQYHVVMNLTDDYTSNPDVLNQLYVVTDSGAQVPLSAFTTFSGANAPLSVAHQGQSATTTLAFNLSDGVALGDAQQLIKTTMAKIGLPDTVQAGFAGTAQAFDSSVSMMPWLILAALAAVYIVLGMLYESYIHPLTILSTLPSAGLGALLLMLLTNTQLTVIALIGILLLIGIVKKNAIMMIDFALDAERRLGLTPQQAITQACLMRFRPILMTTLAAFFGALPLALGSGGDADLRSPLGLAIAGGLALSQILTLFTTPVVYLYMDRSSRATRRLWHRLRPHHEPSPSAGSHD